LLEDPAPLKNPVPGFNDRLKASAEAKKAMLAKFQPKAAAQDPDFERRHAEREAELERVRAERAAERQAKKDALLQAERQKLNAEKKAREDADQARRLSQREQLMAMYGRKRGG
jgi:vacuolar-type H+-ATPase subunit I/STV1